MITVADGARLAVGAWFAMFGIALFLGLCWTLYAFLFQGLAI